MTSLYLRGRFPDFYPFLLADSFEPTRGLATEWASFACFVLPLASFPLLHKKKVIMKNPISGTDDIFLTIFVYQSLSFGYVNEQDGNIYRIVIMKKLTQM